MRRDSLGLGKRRGIVLAFLAGISQSLACISAPAPKARDTRPPFDPSSFELAKVRRQETSAPSSPSMLDDAQIVEVTRTLDAAELAQARLAQRRSRHERVRKLAKHMLNGGGHLLRAGSAQRRAASRVADELRARAERNLQRLELASNDAFDREFIEAQIDQHRAMLDKLNSHLIPMATTAKLRNALEQTRTLVEDHLSQATAARWAVEVAPALRTASAALP